MASPHLLSEVSRVLARERFRGHVTLDEAREFVSQLHARAELFDDPVEVPAVSRDRDDDYLVALVRQGRRAGLRNQNLTSLRVFDLHVLTPREFLDALER